jgi:hypothetical protein
MKNKIAIASAFIAASSFSFAEIALTESLSVEGFIDTSYTDSDGGPASFDLNEVEISFLLDAGAVSARVDTQYSDVGAPVDVGSIDQAFISYDVFGGTLSAGLMDSQLGFEAFEAPGLYTNTLAYGNAAQAQADEAVNFTIQLDEASSLGVSLIDGADSFIGDLAANSDTIVELAYGRDLGNGLGAFVGMRSDANGDDLINAYVTYETGALTLAAEINDGETTTDYLVLANYAYSDNASVTVRYTTEEAELLNGDDQDILTIAHQLALADNLSLTTELSDDGSDDDEYSFSVGALFTF